jgi:spore maturation protein CgeB
MRIIYFTHSLRSCWNHGNAHFLRGVLRELALLGHDVRAYEPERNWSLKNLLRDQGEAGLDAFREHYPELEPRTYAPDADLAALVRDADLVIVHEWNEPTLVAALGAIRRRGHRGRFLFHDTHHRAISAPREIDAFDLRFFDGVLAFGRTLARAYERLGWSGRVFVWHEAADIRLFKPPLVETEREGLVWVGNWGDGERTRELETFLLRAAGDAGLPLKIYGVRYPAEALALLARHGVTYGGWLANAAAPNVFARHLATVHVPRRFYVDQLPGIPTIRVFEALACGIPLVCSPWCDAEHLFRPGADYLVAEDGAAMTAQLRALAEDEGLRRRLAVHGRATIEARHTCAHRARELIAIAASLDATPTRALA